MNKFSGLIASIGALGFVNYIAYPLVLKYPLMLPFLLPFLWESVNEVMNQYKIVTTTAAVEETKTEKRQSVRLSEREAH